MNRIGNAIREASEVRDALLKIDPDLGNDENWQVLRDTIEGETSGDAERLAIGLARKVIALKRDVRYRKVVLEELKKEQEEKKNKIASLERNIDSLEGIVQSLQASITPQGKPVRLKAPGVSGWVVKRGDTQRKLLKIDAAKTPAEYTDTAPTYRTAEIKAALLAGKDVPGWALDNAPDGFTITER